MSLTYANPLKEQPLLPMLEELVEGDIDSKPKFDRWKSSFKNKFDKFLTQDGSKAAEKAYRNFHQKVVKLSNVFEKLEDHIEQGEGALMKVSAQKCLADLKACTTDTVDGLADLLPGSGQGEKTKELGYTNYHMGAMLIGDGFSLYAYLDNCDQILVEYKDNKLSSVDKQILEELENYHRKFQAFCDVMADLGLYEAMMKSREILEEDEDNDEETVATEPESDSSSSDSSAPTSAPVVKKKPLKRRKRRRKTRITPKPTAKPQIPAQIPRGSLRGSRHTKPIPRSSLRGSLHAAGPPHKPNGAPRGVVPAYLMNALDKQPSNHEPTKQSSVSPKKAKSFDSDEPSSQHKPTGRNSMPPQKVAPVLPSEQRRFSQNPQRFSQNPQRGGKPVSSLKAALNAGQSPKSPEEKLSPSSEHSWLSKPRGNGPPTKRGSVLPKMPVDNGVSVSEHTPTKRSSMPPQKMNALVPAFPNSGPRSSSSTVPSSSPAFPKAGPRRSSSTIPLASPAFPKHGPRRSVSSLKVAVKTSQAQQEHYDDSSSSDPSDSETFAEESDRHVRASPASDHPWITKPRGNGPAKRSSMLPKMPVDDRVSVSEHKPTKRSSMPPQKMNALVPSRPTFPMVGSRRSSSTVPSSSPAFPKAGPRRSSSSLKAAVEKPQAAGEPDEDSSSWDPSTSFPEEFDRHFVVGEPGAPQKNVGRAAPLPLLSSTLVRSEHSILSKYMGSAGNSPGNDDDASDSEEDAPKVSSKVGLVSWPNKYPITSKPASGSPDTKREEPKSAPKPDNASGSEEDPPKGPAGRVDKRVEECSTPSRRKTLPSKLDLAVPIMTLSKPKDTSASKPTSGSPPTTKREEPKRPVSKPDDPSDSEENAPLPVASRWPHKYPNTSKPASGSPPIIKREEPKPASKPQPPVSDPSSAKRPVSSSGAGAGNGNGGGAYVLTITLNETTEGSIKPRMVVIGHGENGEMGDSLETNVVLKHVMQAMKNPGDYDLSYFMNVGK